MEFKGTKGKWNLKEFNDARLKFRFVLFSENGDNVCKILRDDNDNSEEEKANAKLIACAPEMLKHLTFLIEAVEHEDIIVKENIDNDGQESLFCKLYTEIIATVKKATT